MSHPGSATPGQGKTDTVAPILPSASSPFASSHRSLRAAGLQRGAQGTDVKAGTDLREVVDAKQDAEVKDKGKKKDTNFMPAKSWLHFVAGGLGGMCGAIITSPLDVVKTRLQSSLYQHAGSKATSASASTVTPASSSLASGGAPGTVRRLLYHFVETGQILRDIQRYEGARALFKGLGPTLVGVIPARSINFFAYGNGKQVLAQKFNGGRETPIVHLSAAAMAGLITATATNPIWVVKTRLQLQYKEKKAAAEKTASTGASAANKTSAVGAVARSGGGASLALPQRALHAAADASTAARPPRFTPSFFPAQHPAAVTYTNSFSLTMHIIQTEGVRGLYKGLSASYLGVTEGTIQWVLYEQLKRWGGATGAAEVDGGRKKSGGKVKRWFSTVGAAGGAKLVASLITYPHEVIRTRLRQEPPPPSPGAPKPPRKYTGLMQTARLVIKEEGAAALYGGLSAHLLRVVPNAAVMFSIYELALRFSG